MALHLWYPSAETGEVHQARRLVIQHLRARGFRIALDPETEKQYPVLSKDHHKGSKKLRTSTTLTLEVKVVLSGRHLEIKFFQNHNFENRNGGYYDFDKFEKAPYLVRKAYLLERDKIAEALKASGFPNLQCESRPTGMAFIRYQREELCESHGDDFYSRPQCPSNSKMRSGLTLQDGMTVYCRRRGRVLRGTAYHHINNMWWVLLPGGDVINDGCFNLYSRCDIQNLKGRYFPGDQRKQRVERLLDSAVKAENFLRAQTLKTVRDGIECAAA